MINTICKNNDDKNNAYNSAWQKTTLKKTHSQHMSSTVEGKFRDLLNDSSGKSVK